jgi:gliding motility-associated-like protein
LVLPPPYNVEKLTQHPQFPPFKAKRQNDLQVHSWKATFPLVFHVKRFILLGLWLCLGLQLTGQENLITNGSFEDIDSCYGDPAGLGFDVFQWTGCTGWSCPTYGSSDLWCADPVFGNQSPPLIPGFGYQHPRTGEAMSGIFVFVQHEEYREYIQNELVEPLQNDVYYRFSMYTSNSFYDETFSSSTSCMQVYFSEFSIYQPLSYLALPVTPQIKNSPNNFYTDTLNWILFEGIFKANGGEKYVTIGCFENDVNIPLSIEVTDTTGGDIYFFIDDVELVKTSSKVSFPNVFTPNGDSINDVFSPEIVNVPNWEVFIFNRWGNAVAVLNENNPTWNGKINDNWASDGVYYYLLKSSDEIFQEHGFFHLIK